MPFDAIDFVYCLQLNTMSANQIQTLLIYNVYAVFSDYVNLV